ncbi:acyl transferase/acyl hydrolase/lysophospholipase [Dimargaris cristalligena]|uniref:[acyl-carrier-protein] S-malonyltransferase n=1 Tax=Dimargaris cristalligena TaxID=215637 RepID=A0A4V1J590_9FUNG|nr:acyl transferase/acyl hydrolase/lysophospholipase [Dimargaris cristalligena]|eukprot:RKP38229.1 acyl transferase/acyl hydrolase/lysophospholipase [Dimargaris cristalligena]
MGKDLHATFPVARSVFEEVDDTLQFKLSTLMFEGNQDELTLTQNAQPAILATSIALLRVLQTECGFNIGQNGAYALGHSLGEYTALVATGALSLSDAVSLVRLRGSAMQDIVNKRDQRTAMTALVLHGTSIASLKKHLDSIQPQLPPHEVAELANINSSRQVVLSGTRHGVGLAVQELQARRLAARAIDLPVSAPFHCSLMQPAATVMAQAFGLAPKPSPSPPSSTSPSSTSSSAPSPLPVLPVPPLFHTPIIPVISNVTARPVVDPQQFPQLLVDQVTRSVQWAPSVEYCQTSGILDFIAFGPGKVLANLLKREHPEDKIKNVTNVTDIRDFRNDINP